ncbi:MAG TPA: hypothetical protein ENJ16_02550, partial [Planctomycetaceae bacterium]|nr:hypothetical protein [Planctomycetaceae bacterium]
MKHTTLWMLAAVACVSMSGAAIGQTLKQPASVRPVNTEYYYIEDEPSPSDVAQPTVEGSKDIVVIGDCDSCGGGGCSDCGAGFRLFPNAECCERWM